MIPGRFATDYDGTGDYSLRGADLSGNADRKVGILSTRLRIDGGAGRRYVIRNILNRVIVRVTAGEILEILLKNAAGVTISHFATSALSGFPQVMAAWDLGNLTAQMYVGDSSDYNETTAPVDDNIDYTDTNWCFAFGVGGVQHFNGAISEFYLNLAETIDLSVAANRRKFLDARGYPVPLGKDGSTPTGSQPIIYAPDGNPVNNKGYGGNFLQSGSPERIWGPGKQWPASSQYRAGYRVGWDIVA